MIVTKTGIKLKSTDKVANTPEKVLALMADKSKGERRAIRKKLYEIGKINLAAAR